VAGLSYLLFHVRDAVTVIGILFTLFVLIASIVILYCSYRETAVLQYLRKKAAQPVRTDQDGQILSLEKQLQNMEMRSLQSQINPHFLYNTLDSIRARALVEGTEEIADMTEILSSFFRYCISGNESLVKVREELRHMEDYYAIQKFRFEDRISMNVELADEEIRELYMPRMTLQPIVENAFIHGLEKVSRKGEILIRFEREDDRLVITVSDNGAGMDRNTLAEMNAKLKTVKASGNSGEKHSGIAVTNVNARIRLTFGEDYGIRVRSLEGNGTDVIVTIPVIDDFTRVKYLEGDET